MAELGQDAGVSDGRPCGHGPTSELPVPILWPCCFAIAIGGFIVIVALVGLLYDTLSQRKRGDHNNGH